VLREETALEGRVIRLLFRIPYRYGMSTTFRVEARPVAAVVLGEDREEVGTDVRKLVAVAWRPLDEVQENPEIKELLRTL